MGTSTFKEDSPSSNSLERIRFAYWLDPEIKGMREGRKEEEMKKEIF